MSQPASERKLTAPFALVIEDDAHASQMFQTALQDAGYVTEVFSNGYEAQARLVFTAPELILLDIHLPGLSGEVLLRQLRGRNRLANVAVLIVTGDPKAAERYQFEGYQALLKPVGYEAIRTIAEQLLATMA